MLKNDYQLVDWQQEKHPSFKNSGFSNNHLNALMDFCTDKWPK